MSFISSLSRAKLLAACFVFLPGPSAANSDCRNCILEAVTLTRTIGQPNTFAFNLIGDPQADYVVAIDDGNSLGANAEISLDGRPLLATSNSSRLSSFTQVNVKLERNSILAVRLTGKPGSTLTVAVKGGAKILGPEGGRVVAPNSVVSLVVPAGAVSELTEFSIAPALDFPEGNFGQAFELGPPGQNFGREINLIFKFNPALIPDEWSETSLTLATALDSEWVEIPTTIDFESETLNAVATHFSVYATKISNPSDVSTPDSRSWTSNSGCWSSSDPSYNARAGSLAKALFGLTSPPTKGVGCVTEPYRANGYSYYWPTLENHAGIDFRVQSQSPVFALADGVVDLASLDVKAGKSTLTIRSTIGGKQYYLQYLHCQSHEQKRGGVSLGILSEGRSVQAGDQVCIAGSVGALAAHLHFEAKEIWMDSSNLRALSGSHCPDLSFLGWNSVTGLFDKLTKPGCPLGYITANTVDPSNLVSQVGEQLRSQWLTFALGDPRKPGDGDSVTPCCGGAILSNPIPLGDAPNGLTVTAFLSGNNAPTAYPAFVVATKTPPGLCGSSLFVWPRGDFGTVYVGGKIGGYQHFASSQYSEIVGFFNQNLGSACPRISIQDLVITTLWLRTVPTLSTPLFGYSLDAAYLGVGRQLPP